MKLKYGVAGTLLMFSLTGCGGGGSVVDYSDSYATEEKMDKLSIVSNIETLLFGEQSYTLSSNDYNTVINHEEIMTEYINGYNATVLEINETLTDSSQNTSSLLYRDKYKLGTGLVLERVYGDPQNSNFTSTNICSLESVSDSTYGVPSAVLSKTNDPFETYYECSDGTSYKNIWTLTTDENIDKATLEIKNIYYDSTGANTRTTTDKHTVIGDNTTLYSSRNIIDYSNSLTINLFK